MTGPALAEALKAKARHEGVVRPGYADPPPRLAGSRPGRPSRSLSVAALESRVREVLTTAHPRD
jgi:hypothetical protein